MKLLPLVTVAVALVARPAVAVVYTLGGPFAFTLTTPAFVTDTRTFAAADYLYFTAGAFGRVGRYDELLGRAYTPTVGDAAAAVPEPAAWAMMTGGLLATGGVLRRRRARPTPGRAG